jgi:aminopeptidase N
MNIAAQPPVQADQTVYLKDYQKPSFLVESINLEVNIVQE